MPFLPPNQQRQSTESNKIVFFGQSTIIGTDLWWDNSYKRYNLQQFTAEPYKMVRLSDEYDMVRPAAQCGVLYEGLASSAEWNILNELLG